MLLNMQHNHHCGNKMICHLNLKTQELMRQWETADSQQALCLSQAVSKEPRSLQLMTGVISSASYPAAALGITFTCSPADISGHTACLCHGCMLACCASIAMQLQKLEDNAEGLLSELLSQSKQCV